MSQKTIALQLRTLAADPASQSLLLKEASCLSGLVALLNADNEEDVLILSLQALQFLAAPAAHHATLVNQAGLVLALTLLTDKPSITIKTLAQNVLNSLENYINGASGAPATPGARRTPIHSRGGSRGNTRPTTPSAGRDNSGNGAMGAIAPRYLNHVMFTITSATGALDKLAQGEVEKALVSLKGVISVTYSASGGKDKQPCFTLYTSLRPAVLSPLVVKAVTDLRGGFVASMVSKGDSSDKENQENDVPISKQAAPAYLKSGPSYLKAAPKAAATPAASSGPAYLSSSSASSGGSRALTTHTTATSASDSAQGLAARYSAAKAKAPAATAAPAAKKGLLSSVTSYFW